MFSRLFRSSCLISSKIKSTNKIKIYTFRYLSSSRNDDDGDKKDVPENFYNEELESEKNYMDLAKSLKIGGLEKLTSINYSATEEQVDELEYDKDGDNDGEDGDNDDEDGDNNDEIYYSIIKEYLHSDGDEPLIPMSNEVQEALQAQFFPSNKPQNNIKNPFHTEPLINKFIPKSSSVNILPHEQQKRACPGKLQRHGKTSDLKCHLVDYDKLNYLDVMTLGNFLSEDGEIMGRKATGLCTKCQRKVAKTIKTSRNFGLMPHIGQYTIQECRPWYTKKLFHENSSKINHRVVSKTIL